MKSVSFRDLLVFPELSGYKENDLLDPKLDSVVRPYVYMMGIDTEYPVEYTANNHRDLNNNTGVGYRIVGDIRCDREFINSPWCDLIDRVAVSGYQDYSLTHDLLEMMNRTVDFEAFDADNDLGYVEADFTPDQIEPDYVEVSTQLSFMRKKILDVRGSFVSMME